MRGVFFLFWICLLLAPSLSQAQDSAYLAELIADARQRNLADSPEWQTLLHYRRVLGGMESFADDETFFNAPGGKTNPQLELEATLRSFFVPQTKEQAASGEETVQHPQCRFIARYEWLKSEQGFDAGRLPEQPCSRFNEWYTSLNPAGITLIFPAAYLNNPASMFGHTFLRIDATGQDEKTRLLAYTTSYAAATLGEGGAVFALKGLFGGYRGGFSVKPYYEQVKQYSDLEHRDIWEYELALSAEQRRRVLTHLWELGHTYFDYFFLDENCSFHLLSLLDYARPELELSSRFPLWAIPADTVRAVNEAPGLVRSAVFRPASATVIRRRMSLLGEDEQTLAYRLALGAESPDANSCKVLEEDNRARVFELAIAYLDYLRLSGKGPQEARPDVSRKLMIARSEIAAALEPVEVMPPAVRPEQGHRTARAALGVGRRGGAWLSEAKLRLAYHDLLDAQDGYAEGSQLNFFSAVMRQREQDKLKLESFHPLEIVSLSPRDLFIHPWSWNFSSGVERRRIDGEAGKLAGVLRGGAGAAFRPVSRLLVFSLLDAALEYSPDYEQSEWAGGLGPWAGIIVDFTERLRLMPQVRVMRFGVGREYDSLRLGADARLTLSRNNALVFSSARTGEFGSYANEWLLGWQLYF